MSKSTNVLELENIKTEKKEIKTAFKIRPIFIGITFLFLLFLF